MCIASISCIKNRCHFHVLYLICTGSVLFSFCEAVHLYIFGEKGSRKFVYVPFVSFPISFAKTFIQGIKMLVYTFF